MPSVKLQECSATNLHFKIIRVVFTHPVERIHQFIKETQFSLNQSVFQCLHVWFCHNL